MDPPLEPCPVCGCASQNVSEGVVPTEVVFRCRRCAHIWRVLIAPEEIIVRRSDAAEEGT